MEQSGGGDWHPSRNDIALWSVLSLVLMVIGLIVFAGAWSSRWGLASVEFTGLEMLAALGVTLALVVGRGMASRWWAGCCPRSTVPVRIRGFRAVSSR